VDLNAGSPVDWTEAVDIGGGLGARTLAARIVLVNDTLAVVAINEAGYLWWALFVGGVWLPTGFDAGLLYSTSGQLDAVAAEGAINVLAFDRNGRAVIRRLRFSTLFAIAPMLMPEALFPLAI
jgi:hypothetical protein